MASNLWAYFKERFPVINMALFAILFLTVHAVATYFSETSGFVFGWREVMGIAAWLVVTAVLSGPCTAAMAANTASN